MAQTAELHTYSTVRPVPHKLRYHCLTPEIVSFEILGMLSQTFHIPDTFYTYIPNPTPDVWDSRAVSLPMLVQAFKDHFQQNLPGRPRNRTVVAKLNSHLDEIIDRLEEDSTNAVGTLLRYRALHSAIASADEILTAKSKNSASSHAELNNIKPPSTKDETGKPSKQHGPVGKVPGLRLETDHQRNRRIMVQDVLRSHIQEVLRLLNERDARAGDQRLLVPEYGRPQSRGRARSASISPHPDAGPNFEDMDEASPDERQHKMMEVYFQRIRRVAVPHAKESANRRASIIRSPIERRSSDGSLTSQAVVQDNTPVSPTQLHPLREVSNADEDDPGTPQPRNDAAVILKKLETGTDSTTEKDDPIMPSKFPPIYLSLADEIVTHDDVWCALVFRMICWLMLHDFSKPDKQISRSELLGSRMPVYIT